MADSNNVVVDFDRIVELTGAINIVHDMINDDLNLIQAGAGADFQLMTLTKYGTFCAGDLKKIMVLYNSLLEKFTKDMVAICNGLQETDKKSLSQ